MSSEGRPSITLSRLQRVRSGESRLTPAPLVPAHSRPERSKVIAVSSLLARPPGSRVKESNRSSAGSKRSSPASRVAHHTVSRAATMPV